MNRSPWRQALLQGNGLARRMLVAVVLFSSAITALITAVELYAAYRRDLQAIDSAFQFVGNNYLPSLANSVWNLDDAQVQSQLDALVSLPDVEYIAIVESSHERWHTGSVISRRTKETRIPLLRPENGSVLIGEVRIVASVDRVLQRVLARLAEVLLANAIKTALVAIFLLLCFQHLVTQHLARLAEFVRSIDPRAPLAERPPLVLQRPAKGAWRPDILDALVDSTNGLLGSLRQARLQLGASEAELAQSEARLRMGLEAAGAGLWDWDIAGGQVKLGDGCLAILGCADAAPGAASQAVMFWQARTHPEDMPRVRQLITTHFADADPASRLVAEMRMRSDAGGWIWTAWRGRIVERGPDGRATRAVGTVTDIQQRKLAEEAVLALNRQLEDRVRSRTLALELARDEAERASQAKSEFLSRMSHELRTPMNAILGFSQLLAMDSPSPKQQRWTDEIRHAGEHLLKLIEDLLDLSRIEVGKLQVSLVALDPLPLIGEAIGIVDAAMPQGASRFRRPTAQSPPAVLADPLRLRQILVNLLSNALKYAPGDSPIRISAEVMAGAKLRLAVTDQGLGIPPERLDRLFQPFERLGREETTIAGTGVGLSLSKRLAELMGCTLGVQSEPGKGSSFWVELPLAGVPAGRAEPPAAPAPQPQPRELKALYIEDNPTNRELIQAWFEGRRGWRLELAEDGEQGLRRMAEAPSDVVLLDLHLPGIDGHAVLAALRADPRSADVPVIAVTADAKSADRDRAMDAGFAAYVTKPVMFAALSEALEKVAASLER